MYNDYLSMHLVQNLYSLLSIHYKVKNFLATFILQKGQTGSKQ